MNLQMIIIAAILVAICFLPFVAMNRTRRKATAKLFTQMQELLTAENAKLTMHETKNHLMLGLDEERNLLLFVKRNIGKDTSRSVDLNEVKQCRLNIVRRNVTGNNGSYSLVEKVELRLSKVLEEDAEIKLVIFSENRDLKLNGEIQLAEKWAALINERLKRRNEQQPIIPLKTKVSKYKAIA